MRCDMTIDLRHGQEECDQRRRHHLRGIRFRRYPDSPKLAERSYYVPGMGDRKRGIGRLHEEIWKVADGPVPDGCEIHHADFDPLNNDVSNLACLTVAEHKAAHCERGRERGRSAGEP